MTRRRRGEQQVRVTTLTTRPPDPFDFAGTVRSHGWCDLEPNRWEDGGRLHRTERLASGRAVHLTVSAVGGAGSRRLSIDVAHAGELTRAEQATIRTSVRRMLRLDEDLDGFHELCRSAGERWRPATRGLGRLLRSPTVFEDVVKTVCTTNVQWGGTRSMVRGLVAGFGEPCPLADEWGDRLGRAFPTPRALASAPLAALERARLGYRAPYIRELAERVLRGEVDLEGLRDPHLDTDTVRRRLLDIRGVGPYAAATLLMLLGRYDELAVDSVFRSFVSRRYFNGETPGDREAASVYDRWGRWKFLGYWFDLWLDESGEA